MIPKSEAPKVGPFPSADQAPRLNPPLSLEGICRANQPSEPKGGMTTPGASSLDLIIGHLEADPTLQVRLVGHASSEGNAEQNVALSSRRARAVFAALEAKGLGARVMDFVGGKEPAGCKRLEFGVWACGAAQATPGEARPEDRKVAATFLRNAPPKLGPLTLETPGPSPGH